VLVHLRMLGGVAGRVAAMSYLTGFTPGLRGRRWCAHPRDVVARARWVAFSSSATALRLEVADVGGRKAPGDAPQHAPGRAVQKREPLLDPAAHWMERYRSSLGGQRWSCTWEELQSLNSLVVQTDDERPRGCRLGIHFERS